MLSNTPAVDNREGKMPLQKELEKQDALLKLSLFEEINPYPSKNRKKNLQMRLSTPPSPFCFVA